MEATPTLNIKLSGRYDWKRLEKLIETLSPLMQTTEMTLITFDFGGLVGTNPAGLALLTAVLKDSEVRGIIHPESKLVWPRSDAVTNYLLRMDFLKLLVGEAKYAELFDEPFKRRRSLGFRPCQGFAEPEASREVATELAAALTESMEADDIAKFSLDIALSELTDNVLHHAEASLGGFAAAARLKKKGQFEIAIVDLGIGIRASLKKNPAYADISVSVQAPALSG